jgi:hypothetical protein
MLECSGLYIIYKFILCGWHDSKHSVSLRRHSETKHDGRSCGLWEGAYTCGLARNWEVFVIEVCIWLGWLELSRLLGYTCVGERERERGNMVPCDAGSKEREENKDLKIK